ncbi:hypothetical protein VQ056_21680 [Paenibacillus sp. JTLBN-2024]
MKSAVIAARGVIDGLRAYAESGSANRLDQEAAVIEQHRGSDKERKEKEKQGKAKLKEAKEYFGTDQRAGSKEKSYRKEYDTLQEPITAKASNLTSKLPRGKPREPTLTTILTVQGSRR